MKIKKNYTIEAKRLVPSSFPQVFCYWRYMLRRMPICVAQENYLKTFYPITQEQGSNPTTSIPSSFDRYVQPNVAHPQPHFVFQRHHVPSTFSISINRCKSINHVYQHQSPSSSSLPPQSLSLPPLYEPILIIPLIEQCNFVKRLQTNILKKKRWLTSSPNELAYTIY